MTTQNLDINPRNTDTMANMVLLTVFSMRAELESDFISERTKEGLHTLKAKGITLGKPRGTVQSSIYDKDKEKIFHLNKLGMPIREIINKHLKYGKYLSLMNYVKKRYDGGQGRDGRPGAGEAPIQKL
jgi:DNA invertase Pin-like site-specific DNA recombinase